jgi:hypothetical protein
MAWQPMHSAPHDRPIRLARDNGCEWEFYVGVWSPQANHYPWLVLAPDGVNWLADGRPDYWQELEDPEPPYTIE